MTSPATKGQRERSPRRRNLRTWGILQLDGSLGRDAEGDLFLSSHANVSRDLATGERPVRVKVTYLLPREER